MCQALLEIMEPEIMKIKEETRQETMREAILRAVEGFRDLGADDDRIKEILKKKYVKIVCKYQITENFLLLDQT